MPSGRKHYRIGLADALSAHQEALTYGGQAGIPNLSLVQSAIARPYSGYYRSIARKAAALVQSVATNHGFADGNKRTAVILMHLLLRRSGYELAPLGTATSLEQEVEAVVLAVVNRQISFDDFVKWFRRRIRRVEHST